MSEIIPYSKGQYPLIEGNDRTFFDTEFRNIEKTLRSIKQCVDANSTALNTMNYRTGTWTPGISFGNNTVGLTYSSQNGVWTRIGDRVIADFNIITSAKGSSTGTLRLTGLPFNTRSGDPSGMGAVNYASMFTGLTGVVGFDLDSNATTAVIWQSSATGVTNLTDTSVTTGYLIGTVIYPTSDA